MLNISTHDLVRGRHERNAVDERYNYISTHDLVRGRLPPVRALASLNNHFNSRPRERPTVILWGYGSIYIFQLTTS